MRNYGLLLGLGLSVLSVAACAQTMPQPVAQSQASASANTSVSNWTVDPAWVLAHEMFLAGDALRGRGSATGDEAIAAAYVAAQFQGLGLTSVPGMDSFFQTAGVVLTPPSAPGRRPRYDIVSPEGAERITTNTLGWLQGSDPEAGVILISAHVDHLGVQEDGTIMHGANDDASGVTAVIELARAMAAGPQPRRSVLFATYGAEELGLLGSRWFVENPPIPLDTIVANLEIEMIGTQDPMLPKGVMMMTGFDRSDFGPGMNSRGALITADPYPTQNFFQRSDNYALALKGIVAHTISGYAVTPTYHTAEDTIENLDIAFMTRAIQSLVEPLRELAAGDFTPAWVEGGRPTPR